MMFSGTGLKEFLCHGNTRKVAQNMSYIYTIVGWRKLINLPRLFIKLEIMLHSQKILLGLFFIIMSIYSSYEVYDELSDLINNNETIWHVSAEILIVIFSYSGLVYFIYLITKQNKKQKFLETNLIKIRKDLESSNIRLQKGKKDYQKVIQWQFTEWLLSPSEKKVALLLLKGLSLKEIATCRTTREKTVRKQASTIYSKSKLGGRHELSAWFFEDML